MTNYRGFGAGNSGVLDRVFFKHFVGIFVQKAIRHSTDTLRHFTDNPRLWITRILGQKAIRHSTDTHSAFYGYPFGILRILLIFMCLFFIDLKHLFTPRNSLLTRVFNKTPRTRPVDNFFTFSRINIAKTSTPALRHPGFAPNLQAHPCA